MTDLTKLKYFPKLLNSYIETEHPEFNLDFMKSFKEVISSNSIDHDLREEIDGYGGSSTIAINTLTLHYCEHFISVCFEINAADKEFKELKIPYLELIAFAKFS
jgi:hypothetical protein